MAVPTNPLTHQGARPLTPALSHKGERESFDRLRTSGGNHPRPNPLPIRGRGSLRRVLILFILYIHVGWQTLDSGSRPE